ncbi:MAG: hypothetical protein WC784_01695 [Candidatus Shapirobacteria bacterium]|jgi:hypothetical protein
MENLKQPDLLLVFTYAPAGLGHLRVTDALADALAPGIDSVLLGADDTKITYWHRLTSLSPFFRRVTEWFTTKKNGYWFYALYILSLKISSGKLYHQLKNLLSEKYPNKKTIVVVSTHFGLAHQVSAIKSRLEKKLKIKLILVVQVTDATSIEIWYVPGADLISVPSVKVKVELLKYATERNFKKTKIIVLPYPLSQTLGLQLSDEEYDLKLKQYDQNSTAKIKVLIPISGAAVGLTYYDKLISKLRRSSHRFIIFLVIRNNIYTKAFIKKMKARNYVIVIENNTDQEVVDGYQKLYEDEIIGLEIVKPSEQAFKSLFIPQQRGGSVLLLNEAVGRQEQDNLNFLIDHQLLPNQEDQQEIQAMGDFSHNQEFLNNIKKWRALKLTNDPDKDVAIINYCLKNGIFSQMSKPRSKITSINSELASDGVQQFWKKINSLI